MSCGLTGCTDDLPFRPDSEGSNSAVFEGFLQVMPSDFSREELQDIRDRAHRLSIPGSPMKTMEERLYQQMADIADQLDAITARFEADVAEANLDVSGITIVNEPIIKSRHDGCRHRPFLGGYRKT